MISPASRTGYGDARQGGAVGRLGLGGATARGGHLQHAHGGVPVRLPRKCLVRWDNRVMSDRAAILESQVERVLSEIDALQAELDAGDLVVPGSRKQLTANPLLKELRAHRWLLIRLVDSSVTAGWGPDGPVRPVDDVDRIRAEWESSR